MFEIDFHNHIIKYKGKIFQISNDKKRIQIGLKWVKIPQPYLEGRNKKYKIGIQIGTDPETGKRIRKYFYFDNFDTALIESIKLTLQRELGELEPEKPFKIEKKPFKKPPKPFKITEKIKKENEKINRLNKLMPKIKKRGKKWYIFIKEKGKTKAYIFKTYDEAEAFAKEIARKKIQNKGDLTLGEGIRLYAENLFDRKKNLRRVKNYLYWFSHFIKKWGEEMPWYKINEILIEKYITERLKEKNPQTGENITEKTVKCELQYLRTCWNFLLRNGYLTGVNYADLILKKRKFEEVERKRALSIEENIRFLKGIIELPNDRYSKQKKGILLIAFFTGARREEIFKLRKEHIRFVKKDNEIYGMIQFTPDITKNKKERKIDIPYELAKFLLSISPNSRLLFPDYQTEYKKRKFSEWFHHEFLKKCEIEDFYFHDLRHNWATIAENLGTSLKIIQKLGGWKSLTMAGRYTNPVNENNKNPMNHFVNKLIFEIKKKKGSKPKLKKEE